MLKLHTYRIGAPRQRGEGLRIGAMRLWPRGVRKADAAQLFDVWFPNVAPSRELLSWLHADETRWPRFVERYRQEMARPDAQHTIQLLAAIARRMPISLGCHCEDESHCHRSILRKLIEEAARG